MSAGIDRRTGRPLEGWSHVLQSLHAIFTTPIGARVMRRAFGSAVPGLLGKNLTPNTVARFYIAIILAVELWEPRFRVRQVGYPASTNSTDNLKQGKFGLRLFGDYRPNALDGDFTVATSKDFVL
jgi:phage baseplate assembly protein W